jgi:hypothetical protein
MLIKVRSVQFTYFCPILPDQGVDAGEKDEKFANFVEVILSRWLQWFYTNVICLTPSTAQEDSK